jgi:MerR family copper efflux transcriptional regulator
MWGSLDEIKEILHARDENTISNQAVIDWIRNKIGETERKKDEYDQILATLNWMLEYRIGLERDSQ